MHYAVRTYTLTKNRDGGKPHQSNTAVIPCCNRSEAEEIAVALRHLLHGDRDAEAVVSLRDINGKQCYFDRDYLDHVSSDLTTEPEFSPIYQATVRD